MRNANKDLYLIEQNVYLEVQTVVKLDLQKSLILPVLLHGFYSVTSTRKELQTLKKFQKKAAK